MSTPASPRSGVSSQTLLETIGGAPLPDLLAAQRAAFSGQPYSTLAQRLDVLERLYGILEGNADALCDALEGDFSCRSRPESMISDITGSLSSIRYLKSNLANLMRDRKKKTSIWYAPARNCVSPRPLGVVGVMSPWNYPIHLMIAPAAAALAAGNRVIAKMSETTPLTSELVARLVSEEFPRDLFAVVTGDAKVSIEFSHLPFDHLLFTGSTAVGREIALAAARNLTPVTLELSGKSPAIVTENFDIEEAAKRIIWGKSFNAGQTCVAPDYALVPESLLVEFIRACRSSYNGFFPNGADDVTHTGIVNSAHQQRVRALIDDARDTGAEVLPLAGGDSSSQKTPVTLVVNPDPKAKISREEVFGPVLSVYSYKSLDDAVKKVQSLEDPLALYVFSKYKPEINYLTQRISAAGVSVNDTLLHFLQNDLPFGGRGNSGSGRYHGREGFDTFSHLLPMFHQRGIGRFTSLKLLYPPYGGLTRLTGKLIRLMP